MSDLRQAIQEEVSKILQSVEDTEQELNQRNRNDRMEKAGGGESGERWYTNESDGDVKEKIRQIVAEEYQTLRKEPETSIEHRSGIREFEIEDTSDRWYVDDNGDVDTEKIEEVAKRATKNLLREKQTFRQRAEGARKGELLDIAAEMMQVQGPREFAEDVIQSMSDRQMRETIQYIDRMHDMSRNAPVGETLQARAEDARSGELYEMLTQEIMRSFASPKKFVMEVLQGMGTDTLRRTIQRIDREVFDATMGYYQGEPDQQGPYSYEQPVGRSMR